ncbi:hypothetical protein BD626DRAFT_446949 [Schizophyllum amplum]|uniref:Uncharacterized protein n=1 Tax=Schizophyllum amplum TaxID=97359 RepID=A0A550CWM8_9AGAR|nr:hypothetical protein BD626DRAFT_446949 [Auriculariopsis ampla]
MHSYLKLRRRYYVLALSLGLYLLLRSPRQDIANLTIVDTRRIDHILDSKLSGILHDLRTENGQYLVDESVQHNIQAKQDALHCFVSRGTWATNTQDSDSRPTFHPEWTCLNTSASSENISAPPPDTALPHHIARSLCTSLSTRKVLLVGPEATHHLHTLWLDAIDEDHTCLGPEFCTFHHICLPPHMRNATSRAEPRFKKLPGDQDLVSLGSALLRFSLSSALFVAADPRAYSEVRVDRATGVRARDSNWFELARRSHVVVLHRGPLPAPAPTYNVSDEPGALDRWELSWADVLRHGGDSRTDYYTGPDGRLSRVDGLVNAALDATLDTVLPEIIETLLLVRKDDVVSKNALMWHGAWYKQPRCASQNRVSDANVFDSSLDPWSLYHNLQVYMQNRLLPVILPLFEVPFVPMVVPTAVGDFLSVPQSHLRSDCVRYPLDSPGGEALQRSFMTSLDYLVHS